MYHSLSTCLLRTFVLVQFLTWRRQWHPTPVLLPGKSHGWRSLVGCSPWGREESDTTERLHFHFSLSCIGKGNGNPLQCSCLENPRDRGAWWAAVYGVAQSRTQLKWLSSSSSSSIFLNIFCFSPRITCKCSTSHKVAGVFYGTPDSPGAIQEALWRKNLQTDTRRVGDGWESKVFFPTSCSQW